MTWLQGDAVTAFARRGRLITDDRPRPEYFLLRRLFGRKAALTATPTGAAWRSISGLSRPIGSPISPHSSRKVATRNGAGASTSGSAAATGPTRRRPRIAPRLRTSPSDRWPRARRLSGRPRRRLGQPRAARGLRPAEPFEDPRPGRRHARLVDRVLRGLAQDPRSGRCRRHACSGDRLRASPRRDDARGVSGRCLGRTGARGQRLPRHARDVRAGRVHGRRAPAVEPDDAGPADRQAGARAGAGRSAPGAQLDARFDPTTSSVAALASSSVRVDMAFAAPLDCRPARMSRADPLNRRRLE